MRQIIRRMFSLMAAETAKKRRTLVLRPGYINYPSPILHKTCFRARRNTSGLPVPSEEIS